MSLQRVDRLKEPPVVGRWYLVPAILWDRSSFSSLGQSEWKILRELKTGPHAKWWPVWGRKHNDIEYFNFAALHYHIDPRFLTRRQVKEVWCSGSRTVLQELQAQPLSHTGLKSGPPKPTLQRMKCTLSHAEWGHSGAKKVLALNADYAGKQCRNGKFGLVCPHKQFPLGSALAIDGVITCPLHGLRIDAATGKCLPVSA
jgi:hypothetical protein